MRKVLTRSAIALLALVSVFVVACGDNPTSPDPVEFDVLDIAERCDDDGRRIRPGIDYDTVRCAITPPPPAGELRDVECYPGRKTHAIQGHLGRFYLGWCFAFDPRQGLNYEGTPTWSAYATGSNPNVSFEVRPARTVHAYAHGPLRCGWTNVVFTATDGSRSVSSNIEFEIVPRNHVRDDCIE